MLQIIPDKFVNPNGMVLIHLNHQPVRVVASPVSENRWFWYGKLDRGNGGAKPAFADGGEGGFLNRSDRCGTE